MSSEWENLDVTDASRMENEWFFDLHGAGKWEKKKEENQGVIEQRWSKARFSLVVFRV